MSLIELKQLFCYFYENTDQYFQFIHIHFTCSSTKSFHLLFHKIDVLHLLENWWMMKLTTQVTDVNKFHLVIVGA